MRSVVMVPRHPYRTPAEPTPQAPEREHAPRLAALDAEIVMFLVSLVVVVSAVLQREIGVLPAFAVIGVIFSGRQILRAAFERHPHP